MLTGLAIFVGMLMLVAVAAVAEMNSKHARLDAWKSLAARLGFQYDDRHDVLSGELDGVEVSVRLHTTGLRTTVITRFTIVHARLSDLPAGLEVRPEGIAIKVAKALGGGDVRTGLDDIDDKILVWGDSPDAVRSWASNGHVAAALRELVRSKHVYEIEADELTITFKNILPAERVEAQLRRVASLSAGLAGHAARDRQLGADGVV